MLEVTLSADEIILAATHGVIRRSARFREKRGDRAQIRLSSWDNEIEGACAELAFCKLMGKYWSGIEDIHSKDGSGFEVRWTKYDGSGGKGGLIVYDRDDDDALFVLMDGAAPTYRIVGVIEGRMAKRESCRQAAGYFLLPRAELMTCDDVSELKGLATV